MRRVVIGFALAVAVLTGRDASAADMSGNVQFLIGERRMTDYWEPLDRQQLFGVVVDFAPESSPVHVALGALFSGENKYTPTPVLGQVGDVKVGLFEFSAGVLWLPAKQAVVRPYLGAGALMMNAAVGFDWDVFDFGADETDHSFGFYANAGIYFKIGDKFNIGFDGRIVRGTTIQLGPDEGDADYEQVSLLLGFSFGK